METPENVAVLNGYHVKSGGRVTGWPAKKNNMSLQPKSNGTAANVGNWPLIMHVILGIT